MTLHSELAAAHFNFCPKCGIKQPDRIRYRVFLCAECDFEYYMNVGASVSAIVNDDEGRVLLLQREREPRRGTWTFPGGFVDPGESGIAALCREVTEEIRTHLVNIVPVAAYPNHYLYRGILYPTFDLVYQAAIGGEIDIDHDETSAHVWAEIEHLDQYEISFPSLKTALDDYVRIRRD